MSLLSRVATVVKNSHRAVSSKKEKEINIILATRIRAPAKVTQTILKVITSNGIKLPVTFGKCGGALQCMTCRVILRKDDYDKFEKSDPAEEMERKHFMIKKYPPTSRFSCQLSLTEDMDGMVVKLPEMAVRRDQEGLIMDKKTSKKELN